MVLLSTMLTKYINPVGEVKEAELSVEQVERLRKMVGYTVVEKARPRIHISDSACVSCEG
jgi:hypothetical protein